MFSSLIPPSKQEGQPHALKSPKTSPLHDESELGEIKNEYWIEGNVTIILQKDCKI
jgi:hypothetical protein